jgi:hypothetical protein
MEACGGRQQSSANMASRGGRGNNLYNNSRGATTTPAVEIAAVVVDRVVAQKAVAAKGASWRVSSARYVAGKDITLGAAIRGMKSTLQGLHKRQWLQLPVRMESTQTGTWTLAPRITSLENWRN